METLNLRDFGLRGDGSDATQALLDALAQSPDPGPGISGSFGVDIVAPPGRYGINQGGALNTYAWIALSAFVAVGAIELLLWREFIVFLRGEPAVSTNVRLLVLRWPGWSIAVSLGMAFAFGLFAAHFVWDAPLR